VSNLKPKCLECLSENVAVKVIDELGFEHWFCAEDWAALEAFRARLRECSG